MSFRTPTYGESGATAFINLTDAPGSYAGQGGKFVRVKGSEDGLEFVSASSGVTILQPNVQPDGSNLVFIFTDAPAVLVINGGVYDNTGGLYTWTGTTTITLNSAPGNGEPLFGII